MDKKCHNGSYDGNIEQLNHDPETEVSGSLWLIFGLIMWLCVKGEVLTALRAVWILIKTVVEELFSRRGKHES